MARGWESKSIESQMDSFEAQRNAGHKPRLTTEQIELERQRDSLLLSRRRVLHDLNGTLAPRHRKILEDSLAFLDARLAELDNPK